MNDIKNNKFIEYFEKKHRYDFSKLEWKTKPSDETLLEFIKKNKKGLSKQSRKWVFTIHQPDLYWETFDEFKLNVIDKLENSKNTKYLLGFELGKESKTFHIQGYIEFTTPRNKERILRLFGIPFIYFKIANGDLKDQFNYIEKKENNTYDKVVLTNINKININRHNMDVSDFIDYILENNIIFNETNLDKYCLEYRKSPNNAIKKAIKLYYTRKFEDKNDYFKIPFVLSGVSGAGKSILSNWLIEKAGYRFFYDVFKLEANGDKDEKLWFNQNTALKSICWFSEINTHFPNKHNLLSLLDGQSGLQVKQNDTIPNTFSIVVLNSTNLTPYYIYNLTQFDKTSYDEISRRLFKGKQYFILPNPEWTFDEFGNINNVKTLDEIINKFPPLIYKFIGDKYPEHILDIRLDRRNYYTNNEFVLENDEDELYITEISYYNKANDKQLYTMLANGEYLGNSPYEVHVRYKVKPITPNELLVDFKNSMK